MNPAGSTTLVTPNCEVVFFDGSVPQFTPDVPGRYVFDVEVVEAQTGERAMGTAVLEARAEDRLDREAPGCSSAPAAACFLLAVLVRRAKRA